MDGVGLMAAGRQGIAGRADVVFLEDRVDRGQLSRELRVLLAHEAVMLGGDFQRVGQFGDAAAVFDDRFLPLIVFGEEGVIGILPGLDVGLGDG